MRTAQAKTNFHPANVPPEIRKEEILTKSTDLEIKKLQVKLHHLIKLEKPYLQPQLTLSDLAKQAGINANILSDVINQGHGKNFNDFVNEYSVAEVKLRINNSEEKPSLLTVALDSGFNSKATFNRVFKK